ncbi:hypothetical protein M378DRAFT_163339 [Amanita muscaria Koide BX008]|uniref:DNA polymerase n=1 Tax=Amanita muscaria (strain Koide BX008) TaxID=946122 RepID=A0A0C2X4X0_AMAMK|nr:hypothetical protein M378DRAFT_163339 [Amanita muscaria Koide BX008]
MRHATERTRSRMDIIVRHGGNLIPKFDVSVVTHIVTDAQKGPTLRALGLRNLDKIPDHIPTVKWSWIVSCIGATQGDARLNEVWLYAAFSERIDAGIPKFNSTLSRNRTKDNVPDVVNISHISQFTQDGNHLQERNLIDMDDISEFPDPDNLQRSLPRALLDVTKTHDPLEQFYAKAKAELENGSPYHSDSECGSGPDLSRIEFHADMPLAKKGWTCDKRADKIDVCPNQDVIDKLQELMEIHKSRLGEEDRWRAFSYNKCIRILKSYPRRIQSLNEARSLAGVGEKTASKIIEIIETGQLRRIDYENTDDIKVGRLFQGIYGVGQSIAYQWYASGCRTLDDVLSGKGGVKLNPAQEIGLKFYSDINSRMPRDEAKAIFDLIKPIALQLDPGLFVEIMGSFRRGKADCGDIDILITRPTDDGKTHAGILSRLLRELHAAEILTEDLALPENPYDLECIYRGLCHLPKEGSSRRRIDFLTVPWQSRGAALIYYTGDDIFNRAMRMKARVMGYALNQRGLFAGVVRDPHDRSKKLNPGQLIASETEEEIFRILEVPWQEPHQRIRG